MEAMNAVSVTVVTDEQANPSSEDDTAVPAATTERARPTFKIPRRPARVPEPVSDDDTLILLEDTSDLDAYLYTDRHPTEKKTNASSPMEVDGSGVRAEDAGPEGRAVSLAPTGPTPRGEKIAGKGKPRGKRLCRRTLTKLPAPTGGADGNDSWREGILKALASPMSSSFLYVGAVVEDDVCFGFAAATSNTFCEGTGTPLDLAKNRVLFQLDRPFSVLAERMYRRKNVLRSYVNPQDIVRFSLLNNRSPPTIVGCEDQLSGSCLRLFDEAFQTTPLSDDQLVTTDKKHMCFVCYPRCTRLATYVTGNVRGNRRLLCHSHARLATNTEGLKLYMPAFVSLNANAGRIWCCGLDSPRVVADMASKEFGRLEGNSTGCWTPITYCDLTHLPGYRVPEKRSANVTESLLQLARTTRLIESRQDSPDPLNVVKALQLLVTLFRRQPLCSPSEVMFPGRVLLQKYGGSVTITEESYSCTYGVWRSF